MLATLVWVVLQLADTGARSAIGGVTAGAAKVAGAVPLVVGRPRLAFESVRFGYDPRREILHGVDFEIPPGGTVAVVGHSGSGKSTLSRLLYRFYDVDAGHIRIDGRDLREVTQQSVSVLTDMAVLEEEIDEAAAEAAIRRAEEAMKSKHLNEEGYAAVQAALQRSSAQLRVKRRRAG
jgi:ABC-type transport system involved in Fe-S cluster assembly fused permease/ATPase subunit